MFSTLCRISKYFDALNKECKHDDENSDNSHYVTKIISKFNLSLKNIELLFIQNSVVDCDLNNILNFLDFIDLKQPHKINVLYTITRHIYDNFKYAYDFSNTNNSFLNEFISRNCVNRTNHCDTIMDASNLGHVNCLRYLHERGAE